MTGWKHNHLSRLVSPSEKFGGFFQRSSCFQGRSITYIQIYRRPVPPLHVHFSEVASLMKFPGLWKNPFTYIYHKFMVNVGKSSIHGVFGIAFPLILKTRLEKHFPAMNRFGGSRLTSHSTFRVFHRSCVRERINQTWKKTRTDFHSSPRLPPFHFHLLNRFNKHLNI